MKVDELDEDSGAYTLHVLVMSTKLVDHASMMAMNEKGVPNGHFHTHACGDANEHQGKKKSEQLQNNLHTKGHWKWIKVGSKLLMFTAVVQISSVP